MKYIFLGIIFFIVCQILLFLLMTLPNLSYLYYLIKPFGQQIFHDKQTMWTYIGIWSALFGVMIGLFYREIEREEEYKNTILAFYEEVLRNIELIFTREVERPSHFTSFNKINNLYTNRIKNKTRYRELVRIYDEFFYYQEIIHNFYYQRNNGPFTTRMQLKMCNAIIKYFGDPPVKELKTNHWQDARNEAIRIKKKKISLWEKRLEQNLELIFDKLKFKD